MAIKLPIETRYTILVGGLFEHGEWETYPTPIMVAEAIKDYFPEGRAHGEAISAQVIVKYYLAGARLKRP